MNATERNVRGRSFTTGEKALAVMIAAGIFGYWAGYNLAAPGEASSLPAAAAAALPAAVQEARAAPAPHESPAAGAERPWLDGRVLGAVAERDDPPVSPF